MLLENDDLLVKFKLEGSEWTSLYDKRRQIEFAWQGKSEFWGGRNPTLFPVVGRLWRETYRHEGREFRLGNHGFARNCEFKLASQTQNTLALELTDNEKTRENYPFAFRLTNTYSLSEKTLTVTKSVFNSDKRDMPFSVGAHPAFNCPLLPGEKFEDYRLVWELEEDLSRLKLNPANSSFERERESYGRFKEIELRRDVFFKEDTLVFENVRSSWLKLQGPEAGLRVSFSRAPWVGIWTKGDAPFICLEPWQGHGDFAGYEGEFGEREGTIILPPGTSFDFTYEITLE